VATHVEHCGPCELADATTWHPPHDADLVCGGIPCQPFSSAGKRLGLEDERGQLWVHLCRIADEARARALLIENVRGLTTTRDETGTTALRYLLQQLAARGWHTAHQILDAADYGVPQHRDRVFIVGFRDERALRAFRWPEPTHAPRGNLLGLPHYVSVREALGLSGAYRHGRDEGAKGWQGQRSLDVDNVAPTVGGRNNAEKLAAAGVLDRAATTVDTSGRLSAAGHHTSNKAGAVRLSVEQLATLQGFPQGWRFHGNKASQHRQVGNSVPPALGEAVGGSVMRALIATRGAA
jgi:DNA (cytosine-5)-methyltransferase 1